MSIMQTGHTPQPPRFLVLDGPNLNLLGRREPDTYGTLTLDAIAERLEARAGELGCTLIFAQSNHEGALIDYLHAQIDVVAGAIFNPGGYTHTSVALHDAVRAVPYPVIEVHLSNVHAREEFRRRSLIAPAARGQIVGLGVYGYLAALDTLMRLHADAAS